MPHQEECIRCHGKGTIPCERCGGRGEIMDIWTTNKCPICGGRGTVKCPADCKGGVVWVRDRSR